MSMKLLISLYYSVVYIQVGQSHVVLRNPPSRTDNDYIFTFDGSCQGDSCNTFCGSQPEEQYAGTKDTFVTLEAGKLTNLSWFSPQVHPPYKYRFALSRGPQDDGLDVEENTLVQATNPEQRSGDFSVSVCIPTEYAALCGDEPCTLQLFDLYYFVSCANVRVVNASQFDESCGGGGVSNAMNNNSDNKTENNNSDNETENNNTANNNTAQGNETIPNGSENDDASCNTHATSSSTASDGDNINNGQGGQGNSAGGAPTSEEAPSTNTIVPPPEEGASTSEGVASTCEDGDSDDTALRGNASDDDDVNPLWLLLLLLLIPCVIAIAVFLYIRRSQPSQEKLPLQEDGGNIEDRTMDL